MVSGSTSTSASQPSPSVPSTTQSSGVEPATLNSKKKQLLVNLDGSVVGKHADDWSTQTGHFIRIHIPVNFKEWRLVPQNFKNDAWNSLMEEFEFNIPSHHARPLVEKVFPQRFRTMKYEFRKDILRKAESFEAAVAACPCGVDPNHWKEFVVRESLPQVKESNKKNSLNRQMKRCNHGLGRRTYAQKYFLMEQENPQKKIRRGHVWLKAHERADGTVLESAKDKYEIVKDAVEKRDARILAGEENDNELDFEGDELTQAFGPDKGQGTRAVGSHVSKKQLQQVVVASSIIEQKTSKSVAKVEANVVELKADLAVMKTNQAKHGDMLKAVHQIVNSIGSSNVHPQPGSMPRTEVGSNPIHTPSSCAPRNLFPLFESPNPPPGSQNTPMVTLLDRDGVAVAKGYLVTDATAGICHGRKVGLGEKKVYVEEVLVGNALIYDGPQDGNTTLQGFIEGGI